MSDESTEPNEKERSHSDDWENRTLCPDEGCIGVIGPDGRCKECGLAYEGFQAGESSETQADTELDDDIDAAEPDVRRFGVVVPPNCAQEQELEHQCQFLSFAP